MTRRARTIAASLAAAVFLLPAGCEDARTGGFEGTRTPGDSPAAGTAKPFNPSSPEIGAAGKPDDAKK